MFCELALVYKQHAQNTSNVSISPFHPLFRLSGISPFMGETDIETMANVTIAKYDFDDEAFSQVSKEALDFISKLLVKDMRYLFIVEFFDGCNVCALWMQCSLSMRIYYEHSEEIAFPSHSNENKLSSPQLPHDSNSMFRTHMVEKEIEAKNYNETKESATAKAEESLIEKVPSNNSHNRNQS